MIMVRAPFRVSFAGGGSDLRDFYSKNSKGAVLSTAIDKYMYIMIHNYFHNKVRIKYSRTEDVNEINQIQHPLIRECLKIAGVERGVEIASIADVPAGTGVGSSSTFTVCLLHALHTYKREYISKEHLAREACKVEIDILKEPIGKQDQYAASYGGLNHIQFNSDETVFVEPTVCKQKVKEQLERNLMMFYVSHHRKASDILSEQKENMSRNKEFEVVKKMVGLADEMRRCLSGGNLGNFGKLLHEGWLLKKKLASKISNSKLDDYYDKALKAGAVGGKLLGAGGGGFFLFYCEPGNQQKVRSALGLRELKFKFDNEGSKIVYMES